MQYLKQANILILGMGKTGLSCARYFQRKGVEFAMFDAAIDSKRQKALQQEFARPCYQGELNGQLLEDYDCLCVSPGIPLNQPLMQQAIAGGKRLISDIELFVQEVSVPLIGITGSNGKTTVTTWIEQLFNQAGIRTQMAGNIGVPVLDLLQQPQPDLYVLELSSFQLDLYKNIPLKVAVLLNISQDHLDRYDSFADYRASKLSIFQNADYALIDKENRHYLDRGQQQKAFCFGEENADFVLQEQQQGWKISGKYFCYHYDRNILPARTQRLNALVVAAVAEFFQLDPHSVEPLIAQLDALPHRNQLVAVIDGVRYVNDSKATNTGACEAAIRAQDSRVVLIAGGLAKGADFSALCEVIKAACKAVVLIGQDADKIAACLDNMQPQRAKNMEDAVRQASKLAQAGDTVLLSPACASFDWFDGYEHRGQSFMEAVHKLGSEVAVC